MSEKRKDHKGRLLRTGESQRKDLIYQYRYTDVLGKRQTVYSSDLHELRDREDEIRKRLDEGVDYAAGDVSVIELLERYIGLKQGVRYNTKKGYDFVLSLVKKEEFGRRKIRDIKVSDAQMWMMKLHNDGRAYCTITSIKGVVKPAFQLAYNEDAIRKNPFGFKLSDVVANDSRKRVALTDEQQTIWMDFIQQDKVFSKYYDEFIVLLGTGMRVSEFCGLTDNDLDFNQRKISVDHQLLRDRDTKEYFVERTKTESGRRFIPMSEDVCKSLKSIIANRQKAKTEFIVDGYRKFLLLDINGRPKVALHIENVIQRAVEKFYKVYPTKSLPWITPHVFRHTFCTNMANAGMDVKTLQYLMGHSDVSVTLNVYTHTNYNRVAEQMAKIVDIRQLQKQSEKRSELM